jgi:hypothetical protein
LDVGLDVRSMMHDAFQGICKHSRPLEEMMQKIFMNAFIVVYDLQGCANDDSSEEEEEGKEEEEVPLGDSSVMHNNDNTNVNPHEMEDIIQDL